MTNTTEMLRPADLVPLLGVCRGRIYQLVAAGELPAVRRGRTILIPRAAWETWLERQREGALSAVHEVPAPGRSR